MTLQELAVCRPLPQFFLGAGSARARKRGGVYSVLHVNCDHKHLVLLRWYFIGRNRRQLLHMYDFGLN